MFKFPILLKFKEKLRVLLKKNILDGKSMSKNINGTISETEFASVKDSLNMYRTATMETSLASETPNTIKKKNVTMHKGKEKNSFDFM